MQEHLLLKLSLVCSILGIVFLYFLSENISFDEKQINQLKEDEFVSVKGDVTRIYQNGNLSIVELLQENKIDVVFFNPSYLDIRVGDRIEAIGKTKEYDGKIEIVAGEVRRI